MEDRGMIKWQPFNSLINGNEVINSILKEKGKIKKPIISEEEKSEIEAKIIDAYFTQIIVNITYFKNGNLTKVEGKIKKIDQVYKLVYLNEAKLLFNQIISIESD